MSNIVNPYTSVSSANAPSPQQRKPTSIMIIAACMLGVAVGLFGLNYWHAMKCTSKSPDEMENFVESINRRLLVAESQNVRNSIMMDKIIHLVQAKLGKLEQVELDEVSKQSQDEAVRISLLLAALPAPPMPEFKLDPKFKNAEALADIIDDVFAGKSEGESYYKDGKGSVSSSSTKIDDFKELSSISDADASKQCEEWRLKFAVVIGVSWGNLPHDLQQKWMSYSCDYHLQAAASAVSGGESSKETTNVRGDKDDIAVDDIILNLESPKK